MADLTTKTRDEIIATYERDYQLRAPAALTGPGTQPRLFATLLADQLLPVYANTVKAARATDYEQMTLEELREEAERLGIAVPGASGSSGWVTIRAATAGTNIFAGDVLTELTSRQEFTCTTTALYHDGGEVPVLASSTGPAANLDAGTVLQWDSPRPGCATTCVVFTQTSGDGLTGGADEPGRETVLELIRQRLANPRASGNDSEYVDWIRSTPGVQIEQAFTYPCVYGPGTVGWTFTVAPDKYGSRTPSAVQIALARVQLEAAPRTDLQFFLACVDEPIDVVCQVTWSKGAVGWADETPWPAYYPTAPGAGSGALIVSAGAATPLTCGIEAANGDYSTCGLPADGQTWALWDPGQRKFVRKKVLTVFCGGPWSIEFDGTLGASDATYTPVAGQRIMPWSDSLEELEQPTIDHFAAIGPGEVHAATYLDGERAMRDPSVTESWPDRITKALEATLEALPVIGYLDMTEGDGATATVALPPHILTLGDFAVFPR